MNKILSVLCIMCIVFISLISISSMTVELLLGDVNLDGTVNVRDATAIQKSIAGIVTLSKTGASDVNGDGVLNVKDATMIQKYIADMAGLSWNDMNPDWISPAYAQMSGKGTVEIMDESNGVSGDFAYAMIPVQAGEKYIIEGKHYYHSFCYALVDKDSKIISWDEYSDKEVNNVQVEFTVVEGEEFLYVNRIGLLKLQKECYAVKNEENLLPLQGEKIVYDGDSICLGLYGGGGYAKLISELTGCTYENFAQGGAVLSSSADEGKHSVVNNLVNLPTNGDLYCFEGGINDYWKQLPLGTYDESDYNSQVDSSTVCGAIETIFRYCRENFADKPVCFIIVHKVQKTAYKENANGDTFADYHDAMVGICEKYSIPYYDAFANSELDGSVAEMSNKYLTGNLEGEPDGCHPNKEGYELYYVPQLMELFEDILSN